MNDSPLRPACLFSQGQGWDHGFPLARGRRRSWPTRTGFAGNEQLSNRRRYIFTNMPVAYITTMPEGVPPITVGDVSIDALPPSQLVR